jgi:hypothetical protein
MNLRRKATIRILGSIIGLTLIIVILSVFSQRFLYNGSQQMKQSLDTVETSVGSNNWTQADTQLTQMISSWSGVKGFWSALIDHQEIDNIDETLARLQMFIKGKDNASALAEAAALKKFIIHIPEKEKPSMENIF